jgi:hypothetical protein
VTNVDVSGSFLEAYNGIDDGIVDGGDTEGHTSRKIKKVRISTIETKRERNF